MAQKKTPEEIRAELDEQERQERLRLLAIVDSCMIVILDGCAPADRSNADDHFTTQQFIDAIREHTGEEVPISLMFEWMLTRHYRFSRTGSSADLKWMVRKVA